jgi:glycosyltransferase involved in cell wall biosynthesis
VAAPRARRIVVTPLVSILVPCYNAAPWLAQTLESALAQTWSHREVIVVDDGSTDDSIAIARGFESRGVRVVTQPNAGASAARNHALRIARGDLVQFLDADDLLAPGKIAAQVRLLAERPPGEIASCAWGRFTSDPAQAAFVDRVVFRDFTALDFLVLAAETGAMMHPSTWLVPREIASRAGPWDETLSLNDDGEYFCRVLLASAGVAFCADDGARSFYRSGLPGSLSRQRGTRARTSQFRSLELIDRHLLATEDSPRVRHAVACQWRRFVHDFFPAPADLIAQAEARAVALDGGELGLPPMGPKTAALARLIGWRNTWRLKHLLQR